MAVPTNEVPVGKAGDPDGGAPHWSLAKAPPRVGHILLTLIVVALVVAAGVGLARSDNIKWSIVGDYLFSREILTGVRLTVVLTIISMTLGILLGVAAGIARFSGVAVIRVVSAFYAWLFRGAPLLVQILFIFNLGLFIPHISLGGWQIETNSIMQPTTAAIIALTLYEGAYMAEIVRGGILSVNAGQMEAALAQGMRRITAIRRIILPQALPGIIPATGNQTIDMLKSTSLVSVISAAELLTQAQVVYSQTYRIIELLIVATLWYLALVTVASIGQHFLERSMTRRG